VEGQVPGGEPGVLPLVGHGDDVLIHHVEPIGVAAAGLRASLSTRSAVAQPPVQIVRVALLGPQHPGQSLAQHERFVLAQLGWSKSGIELVGLRPSRGKGGLEVLDKTGSGGDADPSHSFRLVRGHRIPAGREGRHQPQPHDRALAGRYCHRVVGGSLGALARGVHGVCGACHEIVVDTVLDVASPVGRAEDAFVVGLVVGHQEFGCAFADEAVRTELGVFGFEDREGRFRAVSLPAAGARAWRRRRERADTGTGLVIGQRPPGVTKPKRRQYVQDRRLGTTVPGCHPYQEILRRLLCVFDEHVEVAILVEDPGIDELVLLLVTATSGVSANEIVVGEGRLRILVQILHVRVRVVQVVVVLLTSSRGCLRCWSARRAAWRDGSTPFQSARRSTGSAESSEMPALSSPQR
jgi:hypothetical protein